MEELRKCPFCGGEALPHSNEERGVLIRCRVCGNKTDYHYPPAEAIAAWNRRTQNIGKRECCVQGEEQ